MDNLQQYDPCRVKEQHSQVFTLRSIDSCQEILQFVPVYGRDSGCSEYKTGHWSAKQHIKYVMFLDYFADIFTVKHNIKLWKIFTIMSSFIKTRNSSQCRSHHQKTQRKHHSIQQILRLQKSKYRNYDYQYEKMKQLLSKLEIHNPLEIEVKPQPSINIPSLKVLQQEMNYTVVKKSVSLDNMNMHQQRSQRSQKSHGGSCNRLLLHYPRDKYLPSEQGSIDMDHEHDVHSQQRIKQLFFQQIEQYDYQKMGNWRYAEFDGLQKKDEKFDRTQDSIFNNGKNKTTTSQDKHKYQSLLHYHHHLQQRLLDDNNRQRDEMLDGEMEKVSTNLVRKKRTRTRSLLPFYDQNQHQPKNINPSRFCRQSKINKLRSSKGKCKTLPPRRIFDENQQEESISVEKKHYHQPLIKSNFYGFVSEFSSVEKEINQNQMDNEREHQQEESHEYVRNVEKENQFQSEDYMMKEEDRQEDHSMIKPSYSQNKTKQNLLFCDYEAKGNLCNEISDMEEQQNEQSFNFLQSRGKKKQQNIVNLKQEEMKMNFTKKQQIRKEQQYEEVVQQSENNQFQYRLHSQHHSDHRNGFFHLSSLYHSPYIEPSHHQYHMPNYHQFYSPYIHSMQQYPYLHHNYRQFLEFYIYFLINKVQTAHAQL